MIITHPYQIERHSLGGRNAFPTIPINPKPGHIPYHKGLGFIGILEWDSDDRFCHLTIYLKPYQITKYGGGMHAPMHHFVFGLPFNFVPSHFQIQKNLQFWVSENFQRSKTRCCSSTGSSRLVGSLTGSLIFENRQLGLCSLTHSFDF
jgi:hypothetical protein